jgi:hypothetical protein
LQTFKNVKIGRGLSDHGILFITARYDATVKYSVRMRIVAGDFNDFIDKNTQVTAPLTAAGYLLVYPNDNTSTQSMGGRLDGFFRDLPSGNACGTVTVAGEFADNSTSAPTVVSLKKK